MFVMRIYYAYFRAMKFSYNIKFDYMKRVLASHVPK